MSVKRYKGKILFAIIYVCTMMILLLDQIDLLPMAEVLRKSKYIYVLIMAGLCVGEGKIRKSYLSSIFVIALIFIHTLIFGFMSVKEVVKEETVNHGIQLTVFILMVIVTYWYIMKNQSFKMFVLLTFITTGVQLFVAAIFHLEDVTNPIWGLYQTFAGGQRYKTTFGFVHPGYLSNACYFVIVLSIFLWEIYKKEYKSNKKIIIVLIAIIDCLAALMLISAAQRAGVLAVGIAVMMYWFLTRPRSRLFVLIRMAIPFMLIIVIFLFYHYGIWRYIWDNSNRSLNISVNYPVFREIGSFWTGMGYVESSGFINDISVFGVPTSSLDMYYVYIFFTTGIIGCIIIGIALVSILVTVIKCEKSSVKSATLSMYISVLFYAFWQCNLFTYRYVSSFLITIILLCMMSYKCDIRKITHKKKMCEKL